MNNKKYHTQYNVAEQVLILYAESKNNIKTIYKLHNPGCELKDYEKYIIKNGIPSLVPKAKTLINDFHICKTVENILAYVLLNNSKKNKIWSFIVTEEFVKNDRTVSNKLSSLASFGFSLSRASYYREKISFINSFAECISLVNSYSDERAPWSEQDKIKAKALLT